MTLSIIKPKRPTGPGWKILPVDSRITQGHAGFGALHEESGLFVISAVEVTAPENGVDLGPEYHVSVSKNGGRCTSGEALWVLAQFVLTDAKEDNHVPGGVVRNFWRPVADRLSGYECACNDAEPVMREDKGDFIWRGVTK